MQMTLCHMDTIDPPTGGDHSKNTWQKLRVFIA